MDKTIAIHVTAALIVVLTNIQDTHSQYFSTPCSTNCSTPIFLSPPELPSLNITMKSYDATLNSAPRTITGIIMTIKMWRSNCQFCVLCERLDHCTSSVMNFEPPTSTIEDVLIHKKCPVGSTCPPDSNVCAGGGLMHCQGPANLDRWISPQTFKYFGVHKITGWTDTCVQDWECQIKEINFPITIHGEAMKGIWVSTTTISGHTIPLNMDQATKFVDPSGNTYLLPSIKLKSPRKIEVKCIKENKRAVCLGERLDAETKAGLFKLDNLNYGRFQNFLIHVPTLKSSEDDLNEWHSGASASLDEVQEVMVSVMFEQLQNQFNQLNLVEDLYSIKTLIHSMINSLIKTNPPLLPDLLQRPGITKWFNSQNPSICPCQPPPTDGTQCDVKFTWKNGIPKWRDSDDYCPQSPIVEVDKVQKVKLFKEDILSLDLIPDIRFQETVRDLAEEQKPMGSTDNTFSGPIGNSYWFWRDVKLWLNEVKEYIVTIGGFLSWVMAFSYFFTCCRRPAQAS